MVARLSLTYPLMTRPDHLVVGSSALVEPGGDNNGNDGAVQEHVDELFPVEADEASRGTSEGGQPGCSCGHERDTGNRWASGGMLGSRWCCAKTVGRHGELLGETPRVVSEATCGPSPPL